MRRSLIRLVALAALTLMPVSALAMDQMPGMGSTPVTAPKGGSDDASLGLTDLKPTQIDPDGTKVFDLTASVVRWEVTRNKTINAWTYNGMVPGPVFRLKVGDKIKVRLLNNLPEPTVIHWHGLDVPNDMDGVPGVTQSPVMPGQTFTYAFTVHKAGTFIYHTHFNDLDQMDRGMYGAFIVEDPRASRVAHDYPVVVSSWRINSDSENFFSINGKSYPETRPLEVRPNQTIRLRFINISGTEFHTMHLHGHVMRIVARDANPVTYNDVENTINIGPGQTVDALVRTNADPGTWLLHCHVMDHNMNGNIMPGGLITALHYAGTPVVLANMASSMGGASHGSHTPLGFWLTIALGGIAGITIFLGLPVAKLRSVAPQTMSLLNSLAVGVLFFLLFDVIKQATQPVEDALKAWQSGGGDFDAFITLVIVFIIGLGVGLVGLVFGTKSFLRSAKEAAHGNALALSLIIAAGIGMHNFAEGLAIGQSAATGAMQLAFMLIIGFGLHNATEGFGIAAPLMQAEHVRWRFLLLAGVIGGAPTFLGTILGYWLVSPTMSVLFLTLAAGAIIFVISEMLHVARRVGFVEVGVIGLALGFLVAYGTDLILTAAGA